MATRKIFLAALAALFILTAGMAGCEREEKETPKHYNTPQEAILGKWQLVAVGETENNMQPINPDNYVSIVTEYLSDSIIQRYGKNGVLIEHPEYIEKYNVDSLLYTNAIFINEDFDNDANIHGYEYRFEDNYNKLVLKHVRGIVLDIYPQLLWSVCKRIN